MTIIYTILSDDATEITRWRVSDNGNDDDNDNDDNDNIDDNDDNDDNGNDWVVEQRGKSTTLPASRHHTITARDLKRRKENDDDDYDKLEV